MKVTDILICADGGANRLYDLVDLREKIVPDAIVGDLDSLNENVKEFYQEKSVKIKKYEGQDDTDLEKSINYLFENKFLGFSEMKKIQITITGAFGGRLDQTISNLSNLVKINKLFQEKNIFDDYNITMLDEYSIATCLLPGKYYYKKAQKYENNKGVGILPLGNFNNSKIKSKGFRWDLDDYQFEFGSFISTSNEFQVGFQGIPYVENEATVFIITTTKE